MTMTTSCSTDWAVYNGKNVIRRNERRRKKRNPKMRMKGKREDSDKIWEGDVVKEE